MTGTTGPARVGIHERRNADAGDRPTNLSRRAEAVLVAIVFVLGAAIVLIRLPGVVRGTVWAEDGGRFLGNRVEFGPFASLFDSFGGYVHVVPRLVAEVVVGVLPVPAFAVGLTVVCAIVTGAAAALVFRLADRTVPWLPARLAVAGVTVLIPTAPVEVLGNAANLHWILLWVAPWLVLGRARTGAGAVLLGVVALLISLTEIQVALFLPLLFFRRRDRSVLPVAVGLVLGVVVQLCVTLSHPRPPGQYTAFDSLRSLVEGYLILPGLGMWTGSSAAVGEIVTSSGLWLPVLAFVPPVFAILYVLRRGDRDQRVLAVALPLASVALYGAAFVANAHPAIFYAQFTPDQWATFTFSRYTVVPSMLLLATLPIAAAVLRARGARLLAVAVVVLLVCVFVANVRVDRMTRSAGPEWTTSVRTAIAECDETGADAVPVATAPAGWIVKLSCAVLRTR